MLYKEGCFDMAKKESQIDKYRKIINDKINEADDDEQLNILNFAKVGLECIKKGAVCECYVMCHELKESEDCTGCFVYKMERS